MQIRINTGKANAASADLLSLSRTIRGLREEVESVRSGLRRHSQLDTCRAQLQKQEEALSLLTARLVNLSSSLHQISDMYNRAEQRSLDALEEGNRLHQMAADVVMCGVGSHYQKKINEILYQ